MIPILYATTETSFTSNGIGRLVDCISCKVTEERNGIFECELEYPITGALFAEMRDNGGIIGVFHDDNHDVQPFDIYSYTAPIDGVVTFYAHHYSYRLNKLVLKPFSVSSCAAAMTAIQASANNYNTNPFTFWTDKSTSGTFALTRPETVRAVLCGSAGSLLDVYGTGEYEFDKTSVKLHVNRGTDSGVTIRYGKNLVDMVSEYDNADVYSAVVPYWVSSDQNTVVYSTTAVGATGSTVTATTKTVARDFSANFTDTPTVAQLQSAAQTFLDNNTPWIPKRHITVDFVQLWQTTEYEDVATLQRLSLCDRVSIYYPELGVTAENQEVIKVVYDVLLERFSEMEIGDAGVTLVQSIEDNFQSKLEDAFSQAGGVSVSMMQAAIDNATELITGGLGGYIVINKNASGQPQEILIMDTDSTSTATNVIRLNKNGIGFSTTGYSGPYTSAWTIDGAFVADYITTGTLNANIIKAGILSDYAGLNSWNLLTGDLTLQGLITQTSGNTTVQLGSTTIKRLNWDGEYYTLQDLGVVGYNIDYSSGNNNNNITLAANTSYGDYIYASMTKSGGYQNDLHHRGYYSNWAGVTRYVEEQIGRGIQWNIYNTSTSKMVGFMELDDEGNFYLKEDSGSAYYAYLTIGKDAFNWADTSGGSYPAAIVADSSGVTLQASQYRMFQLSSGIYIYATSSLYLRATSTSVLTFSGKTVAFNSSSSRRYKHAIRNVVADELDAHRLLELPVRQYVYNDDATLQYEDMRGKTLSGFIAEEVADVFPSAVIHDENGLVESWDERRILPPMLSLIQEQQKKIDNLEERIKRLEGLVKT